MQRGLVVVFAALAAGLAPSGASATSVTQLPFAGFGGIAVDGAHQHVFVSGGIGTSSVVVLDFNGTIVKTITGQGGASGMVLDGSSGTLYVALRDNTSISKIDTTTLTETSRMSVAPIAEPGQLVLAGGKLWFGHGCHGSSDGVASINLDGTGVTPRSMGADYCPVLAGAPGSTLVATGERGISPTTLYVYEVSTDPPTLVKSVWNPGGAGNLRDLAFSPGAGRLLSASGAPYLIQSFVPTDLSLAATYPTGPYPGAVTVTDDGSFVGAGVDGYYDADLFVFPVGDTTPVRSWDFNSTGKFPVPDGLAFSPDASKLFAITTNELTGKLDFRAFTNPTLPLISTATSLSTSVSRVTYGQYVTLRAHVTGAKSGSMSFYRTPYGGSKTLIRTVGVNSLGNAAISTKPGAKTTYTAEFMGSDKYDSSTSAGRTVSVRARTTVRLSRFYGRSGAYKLFHAGTRPLVTGIVAPNHAGSSLNFLAQTYSAGAWRYPSSANFTINPNGSVSVELLRTRRGGIYRVRVKFGGDSDHLGSASAWAYLKVT
jgi:hypothetical protein